MIRALLIMGLLSLVGCAEEKAAGEAYRDAAQRMVASQAFLDAMAAKAGAQRTPSGLVFRVLRRGTGGGAPPGRGDTVVTHYSASLADGQFLESSYARNTPARFDMGDLIAGWREGLALMRPGDRFEFYIPPQLAYGAVGRPPIIPANAVLVYDVDLLAVRAQE